MPFELQLSAVGSTKATHNFLLQQGFTMTTEFASLPMTELSTMLKNLVHGLSLPEHVTFPYLSFL